MTLRQFEGKTALVIGGASGIGRALCLDLAMHGAHVVVADIDGDGAESVASTIGSTGGRASAEQIDATNVDQAEQLVCRVAQQAGNLDYLFNSVGQGIWGDVRDVTGQQWQIVFDSNFWAVVRPTMAAYRMMCNQGNGHIVNVASLAGLMPVPTTIPYTAAKHATVGFSLALREEAAELGVAVSVACPGPVATAFHESILRAGLPDQVRPPPCGAIRPDVAAREILLGTIANRRLIIFPSWLRWRWRAFNWFPGSARRRARAAVRKMRQS